MKQYNVLLDQHMSYGPGSEFSQKAFLRIYTALL